MTQHRLHPGLVLLCVLAAVAAAVWAAAAVAAAQSGGDCYAGLVVGPGESCTYPGTSEEFWVDASGRGHFIFFTAGTGIDARGTTINGVTYNFKASKQPDGTWLIEAAGTTTTTPTTTTTTTTTTPTTTTTVASNRFPDVAPGHYAFEAVEWAAEVGVTVGYDDGTFKPQRPLIKRHAVVFMERYYDEILQAEESEDFTRGDMMVLLKSINDGTIRDTASDTGSGSPSEQGASQRFPDVAPGHYAFEAVEWAAAVGVTNGYDDGTFKPQRPLIKRHAVVFMERFYDEILQAEESEDFTRGDMMVLLKAINDGALTAAAADEANRPPRFTSPAALTVPENSTAAGTVTAVDDDTADTVTGYTITGGADRSQFSITSTGRLSFNTAPDYEHPADTGQDNAYQIIVTATSGTGTRATTATQAISVTVTEAPSAGSDVEVSNLDCSGEQWYPGSSYYRYTVTGEAYANRDVSSLEIGYGAGYFRDLGYGHTIYEGPIGAWTHLGSMSAGETQSFEIYWSEETIQTVCSVVFSWTHPN